MLKQNQESLYYGQQLANGSYNTLIGNVVEEVMKKHPCGLYQIGLDVSQSPFMHTGIYTEKIVKGYLKVMEKHPCLVTRLGNGKVNIQHLTRHPVTEDDFTYISNLDLDNIEGAQFIINKSLFILNSFHNFRFQFGCQFWIIFDQSFRPITTLSKFGFSVTIP